MKTIKEFLIESVNDIPYDNPKEATKIIKNIFDLNATDVKNAIKDTTQSSNIYDICANNSIGIVYNKNDEGVKAAKKYGIKVFAKGTGFAIVGCCSDEDKDLYDLSIDCNELD